MAPRAKNTAETHEQPEQQQQHEATTRIVRFSLECTYPMLMHNPASMYAHNGGLAEKNIPTPEEEAAASRYITADGLLYIPTQAVRNSFVSGGKGRRINKLPASTVLKGGVFPADERTILIDLKTGKPKTADQYEIDTQRAVLQKKNGVMRSRAKIFNWGLTVAFEVDSLISSKLVEEVGAIAGRIVGLMDYRPEKGGPFGRYTVKLLG